MKLLDNMWVPPLTAVVTAILTMGSAAAQDYTEAVYLVTFARPGDTFVFDVSKARGAGELMVDTRDCCITGDRWMIAVDPNRPAAANKDKTGVGTGSTVIYSGSAVTMPFVAGDVTLSYASGVDVWPADMWIRFVYSKEPGMTITAPAGAWLQTHTP